MSVSFERTQSVAIIGGGLAGGSAALFASSPRRRSFNCVRSASSIDALTMPPMSERRSPAIFPSAASSAAPMSGMKRSRITFAIWSSSSRFNFW